MTSEFVGLGLLDYLDGERDVMLAAALVCDVATRSRVCRGALAVAQELLAFTLAEAGVAQDKIPEISSAITFRNHRACDIGCIPHFSVDGSEGVPDAC